MSFFCFKKFQITNLLSLFFIFTSLQAFSQPVLELVPFATQRLNGVVGLTNDGSSRMYALLQSGLIRIIESDGQVLERPFLDLSAQISTGGERGLLGVVFDPAHNDNGYLYVNYTDRNGHSVISRFVVSSMDPDSVDISSERVIMQINQPFSNHNGGDLQFGPDGMLYIGMGDGGSGGDPQNFSQNPRSLLGKMLRIDVSDESLAYSIPEDNPFAQSTDTLPEIWAFGLRNPWRYSFDSETGWLWIADVGQSAREEINAVPSGGNLFYNFGWRCYEGNLPYNTSGCLPSSEFTFPVFEYGHTNGDRSVTGGFVYRGEDYPLLQGVYVCADFISGRFFTVEEREGVFIGSVHPSQGSAQFTTFGIDSRGELYAAARGRGIVYKVKELCSEFIPKLELVEDSLRVSMRNASFDGSMVELTWYLNGVELSDVKDTIIEPIEKGYYSVVLQNGECVLQSDSIYFEPVVSGNYDAIFSNVKLYPVPASQRLIIENLPDAIGSLEIYSGSGIFLFSQQASARAEIDTQKLSPGIYILGLRYEGSYISLKFTVKH
jgi:glucose/arabinose dehydrogenase